MAPGLWRLRTPSRRHWAFVPPPALTGGGPVRVAPFGLAASSALSRSRFIVFMGPELWFICFVLFLSLLDVLTGWVQALINHVFSSTKMREGLLHKIVLVFIIVLAIAVQAFTAHIGDTSWSLPLIFPVCAYIAVMEVASILENIKLAYPEIADSPLFGLFENHGAFTDKSSKDGE